mmetsp:Transcript_87113/g.219345  ORF Transcript_87113/g.219345 Transcript_87113/m.219345 type:complete len:275 (-) Transcript_87113:111-935(-)
MAYVKDYGQCCLIIPLKLGVGLIAMLVFANACLCILALFVQDIRFQPNGYNENFMYLPSAVGAFGIVIGFIGLLGVYDDKPAWVRVFFIFMLVKLAAMAIAMIADYIKLMQCDTWLQTHKLGDNVAMEVLYEAGVCFYSRWAYAIGSALDLSCWAYFAVKVWTLKSQLDYDSSYPIDFGREPYDLEARWKLFQVKNPTADMEYAKQLKQKLMQRKKLEAENAEALAVGLPTYGSTNAAEPNGTTNAAGPNATPDTTLYGPDGMPVHEQMIHEKI